MLDSDAILGRVTAEILEAIQAACDEYFRWTRGRIIFDDGVEALVQVYAARRLHAAFVDDGAIIRMERPVAEMLPNRSGRVDLSLQLDGGPSIVIEFKRFLNPAAIRDDLRRLADVASLPGYLSILAAPCFIREGEADWTRIRAATLKQEDDRRQVCLGPVTPLPVQFRHPDRYDRSGALLVVVPGSTDQPPA